MYRVKVIECELSDNSKVYDVIINDFNAPEGEDRIRFTCFDARQADLLAGDILEVLHHHGFIF